MRNIHLPFSFEEHQAIGAQLKKMRRDLITKQLEVWDAYGSKIYDLVGRAITALDKVRSELDDQAFGEHSSPINVAYGLRLGDAYYGPLEGDNGIYGDSSSARAALRAGLGIEPQKPSLPGRPRALEGIPIDDIIYIWEAGIRSKSDIALDYGVSISTMRRYLDQEKKRLAKV